MGVDFHSVATSEILSMSWELWNTLFFIAQDYGWEPAGTLHDGDNWNGSYHRNDGQMVTTEDAAALATALRRALATVVLAGADVSAPAPEAGTQALMDVLWAMRGLPPSGATRRRLLQRRGEVIRQVIRFLEQGAFRIF